MPHQADIKTHPPQSEPTVLTSQEPQGWASRSHLLRPSLSVLPWTIIFFPSTLFVLFVSFCIFPFHLFSYFFLSSTLHVLLFNFPLLTIPKAGWGHSETSRGK